MTEETNQDDLTWLASRMAELNWPTDIRTATQFDETEVRLLAVQWPNGPGKRSVTYAPEDAQALTEFDFSQYYFLGDHNAIANRTSNTIEARVAGLGVGAMNSLSITRLMKISGFEALDELVEEELVEDDGPTYRRPENWRLLVRTETLEIELSPTTPEMSAIMGERGRLRITTMKLRGLDTTRHDEALASLDTFGNSFLLDLDLKFDVALGLSPRRSTIRTRRAAAKKTSPPAFPLNRYQPEPLALYQYGRSARGLPLLEFLAFYQAVEYFFPVFARDELLNRLRTTLNDPRFDARDDAALGRVLSLAAPAGRGLGSERDQLRATVRGCTDAVELRDFITSSELVTDHLCTKNQSIQGVSRIQLDSSTLDLRDQLADRIYAIRCRIVHTKQDGGDAGVDLLLPSSREARSLAPDVALVRFVAEKALISRASALTQ